MKTEITQTLKSQAITETKKEEDVLIKKFRNQANSSCGDDEFNANFSEREKAD